MLWIINPKNTRTGITNPSDSAQLCTFKEESISVGTGVAAGLTPGSDGVGHSVGIQKVYLETVVKTNGTATSNVMYRIMDPAIGGFRNVSSKELIWNIFRIYK